MEKFHGKSAIAILLVLVLTLSVGLTAAFAAPGGGTSINDDTVATSEEASDEVESIPEDESSLDVEPDAAEPVAQADDVDVDEGDEEDPLADYVDALLVSDNTTVVDTVSYEGLRIGSPYVLVGKLINKETQAPIPLLNPAEGSDGTYIQTRFVPEDNHGIVPVTFQIDSRGLQGQTLVCFEWLYEEGKVGTGEDNDVNVIASHVDINDEGQTVIFTIPDIKTSAEGDNNTKQIHVGSAVSLIDTVSYENLKPGVEYHLQGVLYDKSTGQPFGGEGSPSIVGSTDFTPEGTSGSTSVPFSFDARTLGGLTGVVTETLSLGDQELAEHKDMEDAAQTVEFVKPEIETKATGIDGTQKIEIGAQTIINDTVTLKNIRAEQPFTLRGTLVVKDEDGVTPIEMEPVSVSGVTPADERGFLDEYEVTMSFTIDSQALSGKQVVVYEELLMGEGEDLVSIVTHNDPNDKDQTVEFIPSSVKTYAHDEYPANEEGNYNSALLVGGNTTIVDTVEYHNLDPNARYTLHSEIVDVDSGNVISIDGNELVLNYEFSPESADGRVDVRHEGINTLGYKGKTWVLYETLYLGTVGEEGSLEDLPVIAVHRDKDDVDQQITFNSPSVDTSAKGSDADVIRIKKDDLAAQIERSLQDRQNVSSGLDAVSNIFNMLAGTEDSENSTQPLETEEVSEAESVDDAE